MTLHSVIGFEPFEIHYEATDSARAWSPIHVARMRASYGPKSGPNAGSRASSPGEQAAACDYQRTRELGYKTRELGIKRRSMSCPIWRALLGECGQALRGVVAHEQAPDGFALEGQRSLERQVRAEPRGDLDVADGQRRPLGQARHVLDRLFDQPIGGEHPLDQ